jgi:hypothetical protein
MTYSRKNKGKKKHDSNLSKEHGRKDDRKERLHSFNSVRKGHSHLSKTHISEKIPQSVHHREWKYRRKLQTNNIDTINNNT